MEEIDIRIKELEEEIELCQSLAKRQLESPNVPSNNYRLAMRALIKREEKISVLNELKLIKETILNNSK